MNFQELIARLESLENPTEESAGATTSGAIASGGMPEKQDEVEECGDMMPMSTPRQQDNVSMNLSMNGSGAGGIRDLLDILRNLEHSEGDDSDLGDLINKMGSRPDSKKDIMIGSEIDEFANSPDSTNNPDPAYAPMNRMTAKGDDLASKGGEAPKVNGGGNPMQEQLASRLANMYEEIKQRSTK